MRGREVTLLVDEEGRVTIVDGRDRARAFLDALAPQTEIQVYVVKREGDEEA